MSLQDFDFDDDPQAIDPEDIKLTAREEKEEATEELSDIYDEIKERDDPEAVKFEPSDQDEGYLDFGEEDEEGGDIDISHLPEELQEELLAAQDEMDEAFSERLERLEEVENELGPISQVVDQWSGYLDQLGVDPATAFHALVQADYALRNGSPEQKQNYLAYLADTYGVTGATQDQGSDEWVDPDVKRLEMQIAGLQNQQQNYFANIEDQQQAAAEQEQLAIASDEVEDFAEAESEDGALVFPLLDFVDEQMAELLESGLASTLEDAYEKAVWSDPDCREALIEFEQESLLEARSNRARSVGASSNAGLRSRNDAGQFVASHDNLRDELGAIYDNLNP
jgi:hypothetical protein